MKLEKPDCSIRCPVETCLDVIGGKWKCVILFHLMDAIKRFNELRRLLPGVSQRMLTRQLRELEADGMIIRTVYQQVPPKVEYSLSATGNTLKPFLLMLTKWGTEYRDHIVAMRASQSELKAAVKP